MNSFDFYFVKRIFKSFTQHQVLYFEKIQMSLWNVTCVTGVDTALVLSEIIISTVLTARVFFASKKLK